MIRSLTTHWLLSFLNDRSQAHQWIATARRNKQRGLSGLRRLAIQNALFCRQQSRQMLTHWLSSLTISDA